MQDQKMYGKLYRTVSSTFETISVRRTFFSEKFFSSPVFYNALKIKIFNNFFYPSYYNKHKKNYSACLNPPNNLN
jgi:hypothetical protein